MIMMTAERVAPGGVQSCGNGQRTIAPRQVRVCAFYIEPGKPDQNASGRGERPDV
jgi:hypothetical protein